MRFLYTFGLIFLGLGIVFVLLSFIHMLCFLILFFHGFVCVSCIFLLFNILVCFCLETQTAQVKKLGECGGGEDLRGVGGEERI